MSKLIVGVNSRIDIDKVINKDIYGIMLYIDKLSVNSNVYFNVDDIIKMDLGNKKLYVVMNKIMHNSDLSLVRDTLSKLKDMDIKIMFYDMAVYNIANKLGIADKLVIYQDHLNTSVLSNKFYYDMGICGSYISSDITMEELLEIKDNSKMEIYFTSYGYLPIFYSRRYLIRNYLKYINKEDISGDYKIISDTGVKYPIKEEEFGTTIYSEKCVNLINYLDSLERIDYLILNGNNVDSIEFMDIIDKYINRDKMDDCYLGFFNTKTIFRVKGND